MKKLLIVVAVIVVIGGAVWYVKQNKSETASEEGASMAFGDDGDEGGTVQDITPIVKESILGKWQSTEDAKFTREFKTGAAVTDSYESKVVSTGTWSVSQDGMTVHLQIMMSGSQAETLNFSIAKLTSEELQLFYMDRGGVLEFTKVK